MLKIGAIREKTAKEIKVQINFNNLIEIWRKNRKFSRNKPKNPWLSTKRINTSEGACQFAWYNK